MEHPGTVDDVTYTTETTQNKYGASGKRIERLEKGITTRYYYTGDALLYSTNEKNVLETENILDPAGSVIASKRFLDPSELGTEKYANKYYIYNYDARSSVTNVIAPDGNVVKDYTYDEFGNTEESDSDFLNDITFTSSVADTSSNLQYMNSRFYQPSTGRFLSQDSYSGNPYDPWTHHLYNYCGGNPINYIDPTGHSMEDLRNEVVELTHKRYLANSEVDTLRGKWYDAREKGLDGLAYYYKCAYSRALDDAFEIGYQYRRKKGEYMDYLNMQKLYDSGNYAQVNQKDYVFAPMFGENGSKYNVANSGCGAVAAMNVVSALGGSVNVYDAISEMGKPSNNFGGGVSLGAVDNYLKKNGIIAVEGDDLHSFSELKPNSTYITSYWWFLWEYFPGSGHYMCYTTDADCKITAYNNYGKFNTSAEMRVKNDFLITLTDRRYELMK